MHITSLIYFFLSFFCFQAGSSLSHQYLSTLQDSLRNTHSFQYLDISLPTDPPHPNACDWIHIPCTIIIQACLLIKLFATTHGSRIQFFALSTLLISFLNTIWLIWLKDNKSCVIFNNNFDIIWAYDISICLFLFEIKTTIMPFNSFVSFLFIY